MILSGFGVKLIRLTESDLELVRYWRNTDEIRQGMIYREYITSEMQKEWFKTIDNANNFYYIIQYKNKKIGLINSKNNDWENRTSEGGIFIWDKEYVNSFVPVIANICVIETGFRFLNWGKIFIQVLRDNKAAVQFAIDLGYELCSDQENEVNLNYYLSKKNYVEKAEKLRKAVFSFQKKSLLISLLIEPNDYKNGVGEKLERELQSSHPDVKIKNTPKGKYIYTNVGIHDLE